MMMGAIAKMLQSLYEGEFGERHGEKQEFFCQRSA